MSRVYLDHHTATPPLPEVVQAANEWWSDASVSVAGVHEEAKRWRDAVEGARQQLLQFIGCVDRDGDLLFTGSGTEALCLATLGYCRANGRFGKHVLASSIEHPAVINSLRSLEPKGFEVELVPVDAQGFVDADEVVSRFRDDTLLVALSLANGEIGTIQNFGNIGTITRERAIGFLVDATAAASCVKLDVAALQSDLLVLSPRRFGGVVGVGALYRRSRVALSPLYYGGEQELGLRPGRENLPGILAAGVAAEQTQAQQDAWRAARAQRQAELWHCVESRISGVALNGPSLGPRRLCHQLSVTIEDVEAEGLVLFANMRGLAISTAGGCLSKNLATHYVLEAIGLSPQQSLQTISLGVSSSTTSEEIETAVDILKQGVDRLRSMAPPN